MKFTSYTKLTSRPMSTTCFISTSDDDPTTFIHVRYSIRKIHRWKSGKRLIWKIWRPNHHLLENVGRNPVRHHERTKIRWHVRKSRRCKRSPCSAASTHGTCR